MSLSLLFLLPFAQWLAQRHWIYIHWKNKWILNNCSHLFYFSMAVYRITTKFSGLTQQTSIISHFLPVRNLGLVYWVLWLQSGVALAVILSEGSNRERSVSKLTQGLLTGFISLWMLQLSAEFHINCGLETSLRSLQGGPLCWTVTACKLVSIRVSKWEREKGGDQDGCQSLVVT